MILIVEGSNRTGKSTVIKEINKRVPHCVIFDKRYVTNSTGHTNQEEMSAYIDGYVSSLLTMEQLHPEILYILDRFHLSELVYGVYYRNYVNEHMLKVVDKKLANAGAKLVLMTSDYDHITSEKSALLYESIQSLFYIHIKESTIPNKEYSLDSTSADDIAKYIVNWVMKGDPKLKCYFASPFFNEEQVEREEALKAILREKRVNVFSPKEACLINPKSSKEQIQRVFEDNLHNINTCDFVFAVTDGKDVGTIWECGYAYAKGKPIIYFCETLGNGKFNMMLGKSGISVIQSRETLKKVTIEDLLFAIYYKTPIEEYKGAME